MDPNAASQWEMQYGVSGFTLGAGTSLGTSSNPHSLTGLTKGAGYDVYLRAICGPGDTSLWTAPLTHTLCDGLAVPYTNDFSTFLPSCWQEADNGTIATGPAMMRAGAWLQNASTSARINLYTNTRSDWLVGPSFDLSTGAGEIAMTTSAYDFDNVSIFSGMGSDDAVHVLASTDGGTTWSAIYTWNTANLPTLSMSETVIDLTAYSGQTPKFAILASEGSVNDAEDYYFDIDNFAVRDASFVPIELLYFQAHAVENSIKLEWATASESSNRGFEIQKSIDGQVWSRLDYVQGQGNSHSRQAYSYLDTQPFAVQNYYRIKQEDWNGKIDYLPIQIVEMKKDIPEAIYIFPNPVEEKLSIANAQGLGLIYNLTGQLIKEVWLSDERNDEVSVMEVNDGVYFFILTNLAGERVKRRLVKH
ncbi:MAG: T9SS type A sorting domain-containing protein [Bacteroidota bacterium]